MFRRGVSTISEVNEEYLQLQEKAAEAPNLAWTAVRGLAGEKHAKAVADYARAENERIDLELKKRVFEDKVRQERATTVKLEAEADRAVLAELRARAELFSSLQAIGVTITVDSSGSLSARLSRSISTPPAHSLFTLPEKLLLGMIIDIQVPEIELPLNGDDDIRITNWHCNEGGFVHQGQDLFKVSSSVDSRTVQSPVPGIVLKISSHESSLVHVGETACQIERHD
jgi:hypothetical protein